MSPRYREPENTDWYDVMQACENGHIITSTAIHRPSNLKARCSTCGAVTLTKCPKCQTDIQGYHHIPGIAHIGPTKPPDYCHHCGEAYPWTKKKEAPQVTQQGDAMDILLSWSGESSHEVALALRDWLPEVLPGCTPWVSSEDIAKGRRWSDELHQQLDKTRITVVCITPENVTSPWIYYESGFIAAKLGEAAVCPYLLGVAGKLVRGTPLGLYQWTEADKKDTLKLVRSLHDHLDLKHDPKMLEGNFTGKWQQLKRRLDKVAEGFEAVEDEVTKTEPPLSQQLTDEAKRLLVAACAEGRHQGVLVCTRDSGGLHVEAGDQEMVTPRDARSEALWKGALDEVCALQLVLPMKPGGEVYEVTRKGWDVYDQIKPSGTVPAAPAAG